MNATIEPYKSSIVDSVRIEFRAVTFRAVQASLEFVQRFVDAGGHVSPYYKWVYLYPYGVFPAFHAVNALWSTRGRENYESLFDMVTDLTPGPLTYPDIQAYVDFVKHNERLLDRLSDLRGTPFAVSVESSGELVRIVSTLGNLVERYIHESGGIAFSESSFSPIYQLSDNYAFADLLPYDICVPIPYITANIDRMQIAPKIHIERMSPEFDEARANLTTPVDTVSEDVVSAATHCIVFSDQRFSPTYRVDLDWDLFYKQRELLRRLEEFFALLRLVTGFDTGYAQILCRPNGWAHHFKAGLIPLIGVTRFGYAPWLTSRDYRLRETPQTLTADQFVEIGKLYSGLYKQRSSVKIALKRFSQCFMRSDFEDILLDAVIGLEALLGDGSAEMTYKLSMRLATIVKRAFPTSDANETFKNGKAIYKARSAVVHGNKPDTAGILLPDGKTQNVFLAAREYLRIVLRYVLAAKNLDIEKIDSLVLTGGHE